MRQGGASDAVLVALNRLSELDPNLGEVKVVRIRRTLARSRRVFPRMKHVRAGDRHAAHRLLLACCWRAVAQHDLGKAVLDVEQRESARDSAVKAKALALIQKWTRKTAAPPSPVDSNDPRAILGRRFVADPKQKHRNAARIRLLRKISKSVIGAATDAEAKKEATAADFCSSLCVVRRD